MNEQLTTPEKPTQDYLRVMTSSPETAIADPAVNTVTILDTYSAAKADGVELVTTPELSVTGYSTADLFFNRHVIEKSNQALQALAEQTVDGPALVVGAPVESNGILYNCGVMLAGGKIAGVVPKTFLPNYNEFYEKRWFTSGAGVTDEVVQIGEEEVPFGTDLLFDVNGKKVGIEVCEDLYAPIPPSSQLALSGAEVIVNLSASNELIGKADYRRRLVTHQAGSLICGYIFASAGRGESYADVVYGGHQMIAELGRLAEEAKPLEEEEEALVYDIDTAYIAHDRALNKTYADQAQAYRTQNRVRTIPVNVPTPEDDKLNRYVNPHPFVPSNPETLDQRCEEIFNNMANSVANNLQDKGSNAIVLGLSGGLDSTLALLTSVDAVKLLGEDNGFIHTITMPGPASSERTQDNATILAEALGTTHKIAPIVELARQTLSLIGHDGKTEDITYENTQARARKSLLEDYANMVHGLDLGTGDMSENAQGWCTFNGDHMSMFNPNTSVPKTLVRHLVRWYAENRADAEAKAVLLDILDTPVSPELTGNGDLSQETEDVLGPFELHDFFLYEEKRYGSRPEKIRYLANVAFKGDYSDEEISHWIGSYLNRFTWSQGKREVMPNGPKIGTVSLSPRGDHRMAPNTSPTWHK